MVLRALERAPGEQAPNRRQAEPSGARGAGCAQVLGGTTQAGDWDTSPREEDSRYVLRGCCQVLPSLAGAEVVQVWAGLRPARSSVRLELDGSADWGGLLEAGQAAPPVIHNYGHGGAGVTLHWGCAQDVAALAAGVLRARDGGGGR